MIRRRASAAALCGLGLALAALFAAAPSAEQAALARITANQLRADLTYLASDRLAGRLTPSSGLDLAADFIATRFREAGLEPPAAGTYFQSAKFLHVHPSREGLRVILEPDAEALEIPSARLIMRASSALDFTAAPVRRLPPNGIIPEIEGAIVAGDEYRYGDETLLGELTARRPRLILLISRSEDRSPLPDAAFLEDASGPHIPVIRIRDSSALRLLTSDRNLTLSLHAPEPRVEPVTLRNVVGLLRGSDPALRNKYVLLTAHYDHIGSGSGGIFHGANDNASGTASVMEISAALAALKQHPRRSILFMAFFGEEEELLGSIYYTDHPLVPLKDTIAALNLEQLGRTDERTGKQTGAFAITGPSYSTLPAILAEGAKSAAVNLWRRPDADDYFNRSDNYSFAQHGVIAHTAAVAFDFPDYHRLGDTLDKIDFNNMAIVDRGIAAGLLRVANQTDPPHWSDSPAAGVWREAGK